MLVHPWDAPNHDDEWRAVLREFDFGQLIAPGGPERELPVVVPSHFTFDGDHTIELHLARPNPVWRALAERPRALLTVIADYVYIPAAVNADVDKDPALGVPTSYYAAVQGAVDVEIIDDPSAKAALLARALKHFEPADSGRLTPSIEVGNASVEHRAEIAAALQARNGPRDDSARRRLLSRLPRAD